MIIVYQITRVNEFYREISERASKKKIEGNLRRAQANIGQNPIFRQWTIIRRKKTEGNEMEMVKKQQQQPRQPRGISHHIYCGKNDEHIFLHMQKVKFSCLSISLSVITFNTFFGNDYIRPLERAFINVLFYTAGSDGYMI